MERENGVVLWFDDKRCYGYIKPDEKGRRDIFAHQTQIAVEGWRTLKAGDRVSYEIGKNHKGPQAEDIRKLDETEED